MSDRAAVSISVQHGEHVTIRTWLLDDGEHGQLGAEFDVRFGPHVSSLAPAELIRRMGDDPAVISDE